MRLIETLTTCVAATLTGPVAYVPIPRVPVEMYDERFTTSLAAQAGGGDAKSSEDSRAAAILLQDWMAHRANAEAQA